MIRELASEWRYGFEIIAVEVTDSVQGKVVCYEVRDPDGYALAVVMSYDEALDVAGRAGEASR